MDSFKLKMPFLSQKSQNIYFSKKVIIFLQQINYSFTFSLTGKLRYILIHLITSSQVTNNASLLEDSWVVRCSAGQTQPQESGLNLPGYGLARATWVGVQTLI